MGKKKLSVPSVTLFAALAFSPVAVPAALAQEGAVSMEEVVVVGSRRAGRTATDSPVPVDVVQGDDFENLGAVDMDDMLRSLLPSYNVQRLPISDAATITRPATLRGLPPDNTLVLVNGKRRHRAAVIAELGGSLAAGSQGPDISQIPAIAIKQVEVLRDGAAAQYGSDAIAGVINFVLKDDREGLSVEGRWGEYYDGDGETYQVAANLGLPLGPDGFANLSLQVRSADPTERSVQRADAAGLAATGNPFIENPAQVWGAPEVDDDYSFFLNAGIDLTDSQELYAFGNYGERAVTGGFFYRNPNDRANVFTDSGIRAIIDTDLAGVRDGSVSNCPVVTSPGGSVYDGFDPSTLPANCFVFNSLFPGGFTPSFGGDVEDISGRVGLRGSLDNGLLYDFSLGLARNEVSFRLDNTINPSLGPESPTSFDLGKNIQTEQMYNADFVYPVKVDAFYSDLNVAFGAEYRVETFETRQGEQASWVAGPFAFQFENFHADGETPLAAVSIGANGFAGFGPTQVGEWRRENYAVYLDLEADVIENLLIGVAVRFEDFTDFGTTTNGKLAVRWRPVPNLSLRGSVSTGFRAPTPGQSNVTKVSTVTEQGVLLQRGQIPPANPIAVLLGGGELDNEEALNFTAGFAWDIADNLTLTVDYFNINVEDRISQTGNIFITEDLAIELENLGIPGARDFTAVSFFTNDFETTTQGVDVVLTYTRDWGNAGVSDFTAAWNWTETEVDKFGDAVSRNRVVDLENFNPEHRGIFTAVHNVGPFRFLARASYYDDWVDADFGGGPLNPVCAAGADQCFDSQWVFDAEIGYTLQERYTFIVGGQNLFDNNGERAPDALVSGNKYTTSSPFGFDGGFYYFRVRFDLY